MRHTTLAILLLGAVLRATAQVSDPAKAAAIVAQLEDAPTFAARFNMLNASDLIFDFSTGVGVSKGAGGNLTVASRADFPYLVGQGVSLAVAKMGPCGLSTPHYHPRATEFLYMVSGSSLKVGFIQENGARFVSNILTPGQGALFPMGSFHYQVNLDCEPVTFVAGLNSEDPGTGSLAQRFFGIPPDVTDATLGDIGVDNVVRIAQSIPDGFALGVQSCLDKCKIQRVDQPKTQQQPRVDGNQFPTNSSNGTSTNSTNHQKRSDIVQDYSFITSPVLLTDVHALKELVFSLRLILCVLLSGYVFILAYFVIPTWRNRKFQARRAVVPPSVSVEDVKS